MAKIQPQVVLPIQEAAAVALQAVNQALVALAS
jgi:hypothetical protein